MIRSIDYGYRTLAVEVLPKDKMGEDLGNYDNDVGVIRICANQPPREQANALVHELLHAVYAQASLGRNSSEEQVVNAFANGVCELLARNPALSPLLKKLLA